MPVTQQHQTEKGITYAHSTAQKSETNAPTTLKQFFRKKINNKNRLLLTSYYRQEYLLQTKGK